ncbi:fibrinogen-like YCDxxxxGGGW domain-containing protein [Aquirufa sp. KTFRIE-69F]|uniref:Fibrinogen-like YCDxxxxGGGW domain-containing protein n=1 Tax=Aquirufa originis TaxID=3096514 RepID=A0ABW6D829_9BACT
MRKYLFLSFLLSLSTLSNAQINFQNLALRKPFVNTTQVFSYSGAIQKFIVPNRVTSIQVNAIGAKGGTGARGQIGGAGANISTTLNVIPGQTIYIVVGGFPGQSATAKYGFGGNGGSGGNYGGAGGGLSGVFTSASPANANALVVAGGGGGGAGISTEFNYTGGNAGNTISGTSSNGNQPVEPAYIKNSKYQNGYAATITTPGLAGEPYDPGTKGTNGNDILGGSGGSDTGVGTWNGGGGAGGGFFGGGGGAGGGGATGGGAGGATKSSSAYSIFGTPNTTGDGSVAITCFSNSGLALNLDAGNSSSYTGSSTIWKDLTLNASDASLSSSKYYPSYEGYFSFDGTTSYGDFTANVSNATAVTVEMWANVTNVGASNMNGMMFGFNTYDVWTSDGHLGFNCGNGVLYGINTSVFSTYWGDWQHYAFVMYPGSNYTSNKIYINGVQQTLSTQIAGTGWSATNAVFGSGIGRISGCRLSDGYKINMGVANFKIYNRELTQQEINTNFTAYRYKFRAAKDGLGPASASTSAYQIKQDYPNSTDGFYWIKNANINGGSPIKIYADMTTEGGGWTLILKNSSYAGWNYANAISLNSSNPFTTNADITSTSTSNYSIVGWANYIKKSASGFQYMIDATNRKSYGGIWTANGNYSFVNTDNSQTNVTVDKKFNKWEYVANNMGLSQRMPWYSSTAGSGYGLLTICDGTGNWWGTLISTFYGYPPVPWISNAGTGGDVNEFPGIIWYWVR